MKLGSGFAVAWREIVRRPAVSIAAFIALATGIGLHTAMFSVINGFLLRPLPIDDIESVVRVREVARGDGSEQVLSMSPALFQAWRDNNRIFSGMAAATAETLTLTGMGEATRLEAAAVTANFFGVLGIEARRGRTFAAGEDASGANDVVLISDAFWQERFGGREDAIGRTLILDGSPHKVIGVMPRGLHFPYQAEIWVPFALDAALRTQTGQFLYVPARLKQGVSIDTAQRELDRLAARLHAERPDLGNTNASQLTSQRDELLDTLRPVILLLMAGSILVLMLAVLNVVNLLYARSVSEQHESAVRTALGARFHDLFRRALMRHAMLTSAAWLAGLALSAVTMEPLLGLSGTADIREFDTAARLDAYTAAYALALAMLIAVFLAFLEARRAQGVAPAKSLGRGRDGSASASLRLRLGTLVVSQFALSFALAGSAVLVASGYENLVFGDRGYEAAGLTLFDLSFPESRYPESTDRETFIVRLLERLRAVPGVTAAGAATVTPDYAGSWGARFRVPGEEPRPPGYLTNHWLASPGYLATLGIPLLSGRAFDAANPERDANAVIISREFAEEFWGGVPEALNRTLIRLSGGESEELTVVGIAGNVDESERDPEWPTREWYLPLAMGTDYDFSQITIAVRGGDAGLPATLRTIVQDMDPNLAIFGMMSMMDRLADTYSRERFSHFLFSLFGITACFIAVIGLYGALNFVIVLRQREFGLRLALGATSRRILVGVLRGSLLTGVLGLLVGLPLLAILVMLLESFFYGVSFGQAGALFAPALILCAAAALAALLPALRAARIQPMQALQNE